jgi:D-beta-D-heptose 7-phosphate kinase/D-beta-D-heptose 1-phosphate adenosyltransferase
MVAKNIVPAAGSMAERLLSQVSRFSGARVAVVGDLMLDRYIWGRATRISQEAPVPVVHVNRETVVPGGAANVVRNILSLGAKAVPFGMVGRDDTGRILRTLLREAGGDDSGILETDDRPTTVKTRVIAGTQQVVRIDHEVTTVMATALSSTLLSRLSQTIADGRVGALILEDYAKGLLTRDVVQEIVSMCIRKGIPVALDPHPSNPFRVKGMDLMTPNRSEAFALAGVYYSGSGGKPIQEDQPLQEVARRLLDEWEVKNLLVTLGADGMALFRTGEAPIHLPTRAREIYDVSGAGDTVMAAFVVARLAGASLMDAMRISNQAAGIVVGKVGTTPVPLDELKQELAAGE